MTDEHDHVAVVDVWRGGIGDLPADALLTAFERTFAALWRRAQTTLGDVTLTAIGDRVLHDANERFPDQSGCRLELDGLEVGELRRRLADRSADEHALAPFVTFVLTEFLSVVGRLTAEVLSPVLHRALLASPGSIDAKDVSK